MPKTKDKKPRSKSIKSKAPHVRKGKTDWEALFRDFCTPIEVNGIKKLPDYSFIAESSGLNYETVRQHAVKNDWERLRSDLGKKASEEFQEKMQDISLQYQFQQYEDLTTLEDLTNETIGVFKEALHDYRTAKTIEEKVVAMKLIKSITLDILNLTNSLRITQNQKRVLLGMATEISKQDITATTKNVMLSKEQVKEIDEFIEKNAHVTAKDTNTN